MKAIYRILKELEHNYAEQKDSIIENYKGKPEDYTMPWEKYLISDQADRSN